MDFEMDEYIENPETGSLLSAGDKSRKKIREEYKQLEGDVLTLLKVSLDCGAGAFSSALNDRQIAELEDKIRIITGWGASKFNPDPKSIVVHAKLLPLLYKMLQDIRRYEEPLKAFLQRFIAFNERVGDNQDIPLHFAVAANNESLTCWLLKQDGKTVNRRNRLLETPLMLLCAKFDKMEDLQTTERIILLLLDHGADLNITYAKPERLPYDILRNSRRFTESFDARICSTVKYPIAYTMPNSQEVQFRQNLSGTATAELLQIFLFRNQLDMFKEYLRKLGRNVDVPKLIDVVLESAVEKCLPEFALHVLDEAGGKIFQEIGEGLHRLPLKRLLRNACTSGSVALLQRILEKVNDQEVLNCQPLLVMALHRIREIKQELQHEQLKCAMLLAKCSLLDVTKTDGNGNTALHLAVRLGHKEIAAVLVGDRGCYIGWRNKNGATPLDYGSIELWKHLFDSCIDGKGGSFNNDIKKFILKVGCLEVPSQQANHRPQSAPSGNCWGRQRLVSEYRMHEVNERPCNTEASTLTTINRSKKLRPLLLHPLIQTFITVKWIRLGFLNTLNLLLMLATTVCFAAHAYHRQFNNEANVTFQLLTAVGLFCMLLREILQVIYLRWAYISLDNVLEIAMNCAILSTTVYVTLIYFSAAIASVMVVALALQFTFLLGALPWNAISTLTHMFYTVSSNFLKSVVLFVPLLLAFVFSFHLAFHRTENNGFPTWMDAAMKTLVMTTGEFEASDMDLDGSRYLLVAVFIVVIVIVSMNLINGLAVSDIATIREYAELVSVTQKVQQLALYERGRWPTKTPAWMYRFLSTGFFDRYEKVVTVLRDELGKIEVLPRDSVERLPMAIPFAPWCRSASLNYYYTFLWWEFSLFVKLENRLVVEALQTLERRCTNEATGNGTGINACSTMGD